MFSWKCQVLQTRGHLLRNERPLAVSIPRQWPFEVGTETFILVIVPSNVREVNDHPKVEVRVTFNGQENCIYDFSSSPSLLDVSGNFAFVTSSQSGLWQQLSSLSDPHSSPLAFLF